MSDFNALFAKVCAHLEQTGKVKEISAEFSTCGTDSDRVSFVCQLNEVDDALDDYAKKHVAICQVKSHETATRLRNEGNVHYQKKTNDLALASYNRSVLIAKGETLALAYANRSAVFYDTRQWQLCLRDIQLAFDEGYPAKLAHKLYERQGKCLLELNDPQRALASFLRAQQSLLDLSLGDKLADLTRKIEALKVEQQQRQTASDDNHQPIRVQAIEKDIAAARRKPSDLNREPNPQMPSASGSVRLVSTAERGRCLIATENLEPGMTVIAEKAFASILLGEFRATHCHNCLHWTPGPVPCHLCSQVGFCSTICRDEAWRGYHRAECGRLDLLERADVGTHALLAVNTLLRLDHDTLRAASGRRNHDQQAATVYDSTDYANVRGLVANTEKRSVADLFRRAVLAVFLARIIESDQLEVTAAELLRLVQSYPCNAHEIGQMSVPLPHRDESATVAAQRLREIGAGAMPVLSLINHSCDPNVARVCYGDVICVTVIRPIAAGDELLDNYGYHYATHELAERRTKLRRQYYFDCQCAACEHRWPLYGEIPSLGNDHATTSAAIRSQLDDFVRLPCHERDDGCGNLRDYLAKFAEFVSKLDADPSVQRPVREHNDCQEALKQCLGLLATVTPSPSEC